MGGQTVMVCLVLLSDVSKEFHDNTSSAFKVQLSEPMCLEDGEWEVGFLSLRMPDAGLGLDKFVV